MSDPQTRHLIVNTPSDQSVSPLNLGERVRAVRKSRQWTLDEASQHTGLAKSTLSKIENDKISPTFEVIQKLTRGLGINIPQLFIESPATQNNGRRSLTRKNQGRQHPTPTYEHELLNTELTNKKMVPFKTKIRARNFEDFGDWVRHSGEEFIYVLKGTLAFYSEFYEPLELQEGDSLYYDSGMGHICVSTSPEDAEILWICTPIMA